jgi:3',5'-cyclic AMP phosphodiesterase CpdA
MKKIATIIMGLLLFVVFFGCSTQETTTLPLTVGTTTTIATTTTASTTFTTITSAQTTTHSSTETTNTTVTLSDLALAAEALDNPYRVALFITDDPTTKMGFNFEMPSDSGGFVEIAPQGAETYNRHEATSKHRPIRTKQAYLYACTITDLTPGETYVYRVTNTDLSETSAYYEFTMPQAEAESFTFMFLPDPQGNWDYAYRLYGAAMISVLDYAQTNYDFVMIPGDIVNDADIKSQWEWFFRYSSVYSFNKPLAATSGNHDIGNFDEERIQNLEYDGYLNLPNNGPTYDLFDELDSDLRNPDFDNGKTYSFDYGQAHFVVINTEMYCNGGGYTTCSVYDETNAAILENWLRIDLENTNKPWKIVMLHRGPYSLSYDTGTVRDQLVPIFDEFDVDLVLAGHDHQYSRAVYTGGQMVGFSEADPIEYGEISLDTEMTETRNFNDYSSSVGTTYLTGNTTGTKFYGGEKSSGIEVNYKFTGEYPVISLITIDLNSVVVNSYVVERPTVLTIDPTRVSLLEQFSINKAEPVA